MTACRASAVSRARQAANGNIQLVDGLGTGTNGINLIVGGNNSSTAYNAILSDAVGAGNNPGPGSLTKIGTGILTLSGPNTYSGPTVVSNGTLALTLNSATNTSNGVTNTQWQHSAHDGKPHPWRFVHQSAQRQHSDLSTRHSNNYQQRCSGSTQSFNSLTLSPNSNNTLTLTDTGGGLTVNLGNVTRSSPGSSNAPNSNTGSVLNINITAPGTPTLTALNSTTNPNAGNLLIDAAGTAFAVLNGTTTNGTDWASQPMAASTERCDLFFGWVWDRS